jgi:hypothetical protein
MSLGDAIAKGQTFDQVWRELNASLGERSPDDKSD